METTAIIVAAGRSRRFGGDQLKQFATLRSRPVLQHSLEVFEALDGLNQLVVVGPSDELQRVQSLVTRAAPSVPTAVTAGGATRYESMQSGLRQLPESGSDTVFVHDGARPGISLDLCLKILDFYKKDNDLSGVIPVINIDDTVKEVSAEQQTVRSTLDRNRLRGAQTPQLFETDTLRDSIRQWNRPGDPTDEAMLLEEAGHTVGTVPGLRQCKKITYPEDLHVVDTLLESGNARG